MPVSELTPLFAVEELDRKRGTIQERLESIPRDLKVREEEITKIERGIKEKEQFIADKEKEMSTLDLDVKSVQDQLGEKQARLNTVKNQKEYDALKLEISNGENDIDKMEEKVLISMDEVSELKQLLEGEKKNNDRLTELKKESEELKSEEKRLTQEIEEITKESETNVSSLGGDVRKEYLRARKIHPSGGVLSKIVKEDTVFKCTECNAKIPHQTAIEIKKLIRYAYCQICNRILYFSE